MPKISLLLVLFSGCLLEPQKLGSPCLGQPASTDGGPCPACAVDADCVILSNRCHPSASCVPKDGNWFVTLEGCEVQHPPTMVECGCVESVCQAK